MIRLGKCDSCSNKGICKFVEKMKEYEESVQKNVIGEHTHPMGFFPLSVNVNCETYKVNNYLSGGVPSTSSNGSSATVRSENINVECGCGYEYHHGDMHRGIQQLHKLYINN